MARIWPWETNRLVLMFTEQLNSLVGNRINLVAALDAIAKEQPHDEMRRILTKLVNDVRAGEDLPEAMKQFPKVFKPFFCGVVAAGMRSGRLDLALADMVRLLRQRDEVRATLARALAYPVLLLTIMMAILIVLPIYVIPALLEMIPEGAHAGDIPQSLKNLSEFMDLLKDRWWVFALAGCLLLLPLVVRFSSSKGKHLLHKHWFELRFLGIGRKVRIFSLVRFFRVLAVQIKHEIPLIIAIRNVAQYSGNQHMSHVVKNIADQIEKGSSLHAACLEHEWLFVGISIELIRAGEDSNSLGAVLETLASYYDRWLTTEVEIMTSWISPVLILVMASVFGYIIKIAFMPIFDVMFVRLKVH